MRQARLIRVVLAGMAAGGLVLGVSGCTPVDRHKVLTFFFTGVPPLGSEDKEDAEERQRREDAGKSKLLRLVQVQVNKQRRAVQSGRYTHGPYASNQCNLCHETSASGGFRGFGKREGARTAKAGAVSGKLVAPMAELCGGCHTSKSIAAAYQTGLWVHGPVSTGYCVLCHGPHAGPEPYLLLKKANELCQDCHKEGLIFSASLHADKTDCMQCHNAHLGKDSRMLRADYREAW